jgi:hypothetical protein
MKPRLFIGSSTEGLNAAYAVQSGLEHDAEVTVWTQDVFAPSEFTLESLIKQLRVTDVGVFIFTPDDVVRMRGKAHQAARDNVLFEFGLFAGHLGRNRCAIVHPRGTNLRMPSDLLGFNAITYASVRADGNLEAALGPASTKIRSLLKSITPTASLPHDLTLTFDERKLGLSANQRELLSFISTNAPCSMSEIASVIPNMGTSELFYRMEHLRLLGFIEERLVETGRKKAASEIILSPAYLAHGALSKVRTAKTN